MEDLVLKIEGMSCNHCKMAVEKALKTLGGVEEANVDLQANSATVKFDEQVISEDKLKEAIEEAGYKVIG
ncbi:copper ion binding protein [Bacillota bacterium LX-D]|nr:copper ion binding protein [Bacillota bacterium LX-D]